MILNSCRAKHLKDSELNPADPEDEKGDVKDRSFRGPHFGLNNTEPLFELLRAFSV